MDALRVKTGVYLGAIDTLLQLLRVDAVLACRPVRPCVIVSACEDCSSEILTTVMCMFMYRFVRSVSACECKMRVRRAQTTMTTAPTKSTAMGAMTTDDTPVSHRDLAKIAATTTK